MAHRHPTVSGRLIVVLGLVALPLAACGGDDEPVANLPPSTIAGVDTTDTTDTTAPETTALTAATEPASSEPEESSPECGSTDVTFENIEAGTSFSPTESGAISYAEGSAYTIYLGDFPIDYNKLSMFSVPEPTAGQNMVTVAITTFNPEGEPELPEVGATITHNMDDFGFLTFVVMASEGGSTLGNNLLGEGTLTITALGDTMCFEIEYSDEEKSVTGTVSAPVKTV